MSDDDTKQPPSRGELIRLRDKKKQQDEDQRFPPPLPELRITPAELAAAKLHPRCIVHDFYYADVAALIADGGVGKTTVVIYQAIHVILGRRLWDHDVLNPGPVLILSKEDSRETILARARELMRALHLTPQEKERVMEGLLVADARGGDVALTEFDGNNIVPTNLVDSVVDRVKTAGVQLAMLVIDPLVSFGASEQAVNQNEQALIDAARGLVKELDCCVLLVHHISKAAAQNQTIDQHAARGGTALVNGTRMANVLISVDRTSPPQGTEIPPAVLEQQLEHPGQLLLLNRAKLSYAPATPKLWLLRSGWEYRHFFDEPPRPQEERAREAAAGAAAAVLEKVRELLRQGIYPTQRNLRDLRDEIFVGGKHLSQNRVDSAVAKLRAQGWLRDTELPPEERRGVRRTFLEPTNDEPYEEPF